MKTECIYKTDNVNARALVRAKQMIGVAPNLDKIELNGTYELYAMVSFLCEQEGREPYTVHIVRMADVDTGEIITINTSSVTFTDELKFLIDTMGDDDWTFTVMTGDSKNFAGRKWYKPILTDDEPCNTMTSDPS